MSHAPPPRIRVELVRGFRSIEAFAEHLRDHLGEHDVGLDETCRYDADDLAIDLVAGLILGVRLAWVVSEAALAAERRTGPSGTRR